MITRIKFLVHGMGQHCFNPQGEKQKFMFLQMIMDARIGFVLYFYSLKKDAKVLKRVHSLHLNKFQLIDISNWLHICSITFFANNILNIISLF